MPGRIYEFRKDRYVWVSSEIWIYYSISGLSCRISWYQNLSVFQFRSRERQKQIATVTEGVNVFHCKITLECHFHPRKRLLSCCASPFCCVYNCQFNMSPNDVRWKYRGAEKSKYEIAMALCRPRRKSNYESDDADEKRFGHRGCVSLSMGRDI